jgi:CRAL/TRIO, N-terminal domain
MESVTPLVSTDGFWGHLTTNQKAALQLFKDKIKTAAADYIAIVTPILKEDIFCLQFLRARKFDINNTIAMVLKYCKWVADNKIDKIFEFRFPEVSEVRKFYTRGYHRTDRNVFYLY